MLRGPGFPPSHVFFLCLVSSMKMRGDLIVLFILAELMTVSENINNINECEKNQQNTRGLF